MKNRLIFYFNIIFYIRKKKTSFYLYFLCVCWWWQWWWLTGTCAYLFMSHDVCLLVRDVVRFDRWTAATAELTKPLKDFQTRHHTRRQTLVRSSTLFLFFFSFTRIILFYFFPNYILSSSRFFCFRLRSRGQNKNNEPAVVSVDWTTIVGGYFFLRLKTFFSFSF